MQSTNIPSKIPLPFAYAAGSGYIEPIPSASQIGITNGKASLHDGFPPLTFTPISAGGVPPFGADFNGILNEITAIQQWQEAGGFFPFDSTFSTAVGGYPKGAVLLSQTFNGFWTSTSENNTSNPDAGGAGWVPTSFSGINAVSMTSTSVTLTPLQAAYPIMVVTGTLTANSTIIVPAIPYDWIVSNQTTGSYTLTVKTSSGTGVNIAQGSSQYIWGDGINVYYANASSVTSFNTRTGAITLTALDVTNALGYTPYNATNPSGYISVGLGINQSWYSTSNSTLTRSLNTTYTNSTGAPICVMIYDDQGPQVYVNGVLIGDNAEGSSDTSTITFIVPNGATYRANGSSANLGYWSELR